MDGQSGWDGRYFVTIQTPDGRIKRQDAARPLPPSYTVLAVDNGLGKRPKVEPTT
jgi:hypothetical protein